jgi:hypothetical protein
MSYLTLIAMAASVIAGYPQLRENTYAIRSLPVWVQAVLQTPSFSGKHELHFGVNPYYQRGDFDGDRSPDCAVLIRERSTKKIGVAFIHAASRKWHVVGAGSPLGNGSDDWSWLGVWRVEPA